MNNLRKPCVLIVYKQVLTSFLRIFFKKARSQLLLLKKLRKGLRINMNLVNKLIILFQQKSVSQPVQEFSFTRNGTPNNSLSSRKWMKDNKI